MSDSGFTTVFDLLQVGYREWWFPIGGLIFVCIALANPHLFRGSSARPAPKWLRPACLIFSIFWTLIAFTATLGGYLSSRHCLMSGQALQVEGPVENFIPMPYTGHTLESFTVHDVRFAYSDYVLTGGFNHTASHGDPIQPGEYVRIWYRPEGQLKGNTILRLEIRKS